MSKSNNVKEDSNSIRLIKYLVMSDMEWLGRIFLKVIRLTWRDHTIQPVEHPKQVTPMPSGPYRDSRKNQAGDLLLWAPRRFDSFLIDELTGKYGYSHATIDSGEIDILTGKPVMIEVTIGQTVMYKFLDEYGPRAFARIPLSSVGVNIEQFMDCVKAKLGDKYDILDALTLGEIKDPAKEVCSGLAADCLPESEKQKIARAKRLGLLSKDSVSLHSTPGGSEAKIFISPNGFAEYYGAPKSRELPGPDTPISPKPIEEAPLRRAITINTHTAGWILTAGLGIGFAIIFLRKHYR